MQSARVQLWKENSQCREIRLQAKIDNDIICCNDVSNVSVTLLTTKFSSLFDKAVVIVATLKALQALYLP